MTFGAFLKLGFELGRWFSDDHPSRVLDLEDENQIYSVLQDEEKPVMLYYYFPGDNFCQKFHIAAEDASAKYGDDIQFV